MRCAIIPAGLCRGLTTLSSVSEPESESEALEADVTSPKKRASSAYAPQKTTRRAGNRAKFAPAGLVRVTLPDVVISAVPGRGPHTRSRTSV